MEKYKPKTMLANAADHIFRLLAACCAGIIWFVYLWGLRASALTAGVALGGIIWLLVRQFVGLATRRRETQMRRTIGGEIALNQLLLLEPKEAGFQAALWLSPRFPVDIQQSIDWGVLGVLNRRTTLIRLIAQHESQKVNAQQIVEVAREMKRLSAEQCLLCLTAAASKEAIEYAIGVDPPIRILLREELIELAGLASPATDEQLRSIARRKKTRRGKEEWIRIILHPSRARRYLWFGISLGFLGIATGQIYYPIPAITCLTLYVLCKIRILLGKRRAGVRQGDPFQNG